MKEEIKSVPTYPDHDCNIHFRDSGKWCAGGKILTCSRCGREMLAVSVPTESRPTHEELAERITGKIQSLLTDKYANSFKIACGIIRQELEAAVTSLLPVPQTFELLRALTWMASLFDDEGNFREQYENQLSTALELADNALEKNTLHLGVHADICEHGVGHQTCAICTGKPKLASLPVGESTPEDDRLLKAYRRIANLELAIANFRERRGLHEGEHVFNPTIVPCEKCDLAYIEAERLLDLELHQESVQSVSLEGQNAP